MSKLNHILAFDFRLPDTHFANPTGLQHCRSHSTARDIAIISKHTLANKLLHEIVGKKTYQCQILNTKLGTSRVGSWRNTNSLLWKRKDCRGGKTGYTPWAGACLTAVFEVWKQEIVVVVLRSVTKEERFRDADRLYQWCKKGL